MAAGIILTAKCSLLIACSDAFMPGLCLYLELHNAMLKLSDGLYIRGVASIKNVGPFSFAQFYHHTGTWSPVERDPCLKAAVS